MQKVIRMQIAVIGRTVLDIPSSVQGSYNGNGHVHLSLGQSKVIVPVHGPSNAGKFDTDMNLEPIVREYAHLFHSPKLGGGAANTERAIWASGRHLGIETRLIDESGPEIHFHEPGRKHISLNGYARPCHIVYGDPDGERVILRRKMHSAPQLGYLHEALSGVDTIVLTTALSYDLSEAVIRYAQANNVPLYSGGLNKHPDLALTAMRAGVASLNIEEAAKIVNVPLTGHSYEDIAAASKAICSKLPSEGFVVYITAGMYGTSGRWTFQDKPWWFNLRFAEKVTKATKARTKENFYISTGNGDCHLGNIVVKEHLPEEVPFIPEGILEAYHASKTLREGMGLDHPGLRPLENALVANIAAVRRLGFNDQFIFDDIILDTEQLK